MKITTINNTQGVANITTIETDKTECFVCGGPTDKRDDGKACAECETFKRRVLKKVLQVVK